MSDSLRSSQGSCPDATVVDRKRVMMVPAVGSRDTSAPAGECLCHWVTCGTQCQEKAPRKAMTMVPALSQLLSEKHLSKLGISNGERVSDGVRFLKL